MWPLISPASSACSCFILALISEWPVFHMMALPPCLRISSYMDCEHFTSPMTVAPGLRDKNLAAVHDHQLIAVNHGAVVVHGADAIGIAIESDSQLRFVFLNRGHQLIQIRGHRRIRVMVGEAAVHIEEQSPPRRRSACRSCACITGPAVPLPASNTTFTRRSNGNCAVISST